MKTYCSNTNFSRKIHYFVQFKRITKELFISNPEHFQPRKKKIGYSNLSKSPILRDAFNFSTLN